MSKDVLVRENVKLNVAGISKDEAIKMAGELLLNSGYVTQTYVDSMFEREALTTTYIGNFVAIPHGTDATRDEVLESGISVITVPEGVDFGSGNIAKVVFGIAGKDGGHMDLLMQIAILCNEVENVDKLVGAKSFEEIVKLFEEAA